MAYDDAPSDEIFNEIKRAATEIWQTYDNTYGYVDEKLDMINSLANFKDTKSVTSVPSKRKERYEFI